MRGYRFKQNIPGIVLSKCLVQPENSAIRKRRFSRRSHLGRKWWQMLSKSFRSRFRSARLRRPRLECLASGAPPRAISLELFASGALRESEHPKANQHTPPAAQYITEKTTNPTSLLSSLLEGHGRRFGLPHGGYRFDSF